MALPVIDVGALLDPDGAEDACRDVARRLGTACEEYGFFQVVGHGVGAERLDELRDAAREFFALPAPEKNRIAMARGGAAWRGWFDVGGELTAGAPDGKEGLYFGVDLPPTDARVLAGLPLHGPNLFPEHPARLRPLVQRWMRDVTAVGQAVLGGLALALGLPRHWFDRWCADPTVLFRIFHYPPPADGFAGSWGVAEHTDYGLLTLLAQDRTGGLEVRTDGRWVEVPPVEGGFVCNLGDMLERVTGGRYRSTAHRVALPTTDRYSFPLFLDPAWEAEVHPLPGMEPTPRARAEAAAGRWDGASVFDVSGTYGEYLQAKVSRVFPELFAEISGS